MAYIRRGSSIELVATRSVNKRGRQFSFVCAVRSRERTFTECSIRFGTPEDLHGGLLGGACHLLANYLGKEEALMGADGWLVLTGGGRAFPVLGSDGRVAFLHQGGRTRARLN